MTISPERLRELIAALDAYCVSAYADNTLRESAIALRELEQARTTLEGVAKALDKGAENYWPTDQIIGWEKCAEHVRRAMLSAAPPQGEEPAQEKQT